MTLTYIVLATLVGGLLSVLIAASLTVSAPVISDSQVSSLVSAGTNNCSYELVCSVNVSTGEVIQDAATITVTEAAI